MFIILGIIITIFSILELIRKNGKNRVSFFSLSILLTLILCFRWGQGTDYVNYYVQYYSITSSSQIFINTLYHGELGWYILLFLSNRFNISFELFIGIISILMMAFSIRTIYQYSPYKITSLLIMFPTFYMTYFFSAIRQGLVLCLFWGIGLRWILEKKWCKYCILILLLALIHSSAIVLILVPLAVPLMRQLERVRNYFIGALAVILLVEYSGILSRIADLVGASNYFIVAPSIGAIALRVILFTIIYMMHNYTISVNCEEKKIEDVLYYIYSVGFWIYVMLAFSSTLSQRLTMPFKSIEVFLIPLQIYLVYKANNNKGKNQFKLIGSVFKFSGFSILIVAVCIMGILNYEAYKNVNSYITQGNYYSWVTPMTYPYISVFNKDDIYIYK